MTPLYLWRFYNDRTQAELNIRQLKEACALGKIPIQDFAAILAHFHLAFFGSKCLNWVKPCCAPPEFQQAPLQRLGQQLSLAPTILMRPAARPTSRLAPSYPLQELFRDTLKRIHAFHPSWRKEAFSHRIQVNDYELLDITHRHPRGGYHFNCSRQRSRAARMLH